MKQVEKAEVILDAIDSVRAELRDAEAQKKSPSTISEIMVRLCTLYALIDTKLLRLLIKPGSAIKLKKSA